MTQGEEPKVKLDYALFDLMRLIGIKPKSNKTEDDLAPDPEFKAKELKGKLCFCEENLKRAK